MKLTQVYMTLNEYRFKPLLRAKYQFLANYLTLYISDWLKAQKLDLGFFNRVIFEEGNDKDMSIVGDKAFLVCIDPEFLSLDQFANDDDIHRYFTRKYLDGFSRLDKHFNLSLAQDLQMKLEHGFTNQFKYETVIKSKKAGDVIVRVLHRYKFDSYVLVVQFISKTKAILDEKVIFSCDPDPFIVHYEINKVEIDDSKVKVINKVRKESLVYEL